MTEEELLKNACLLSQKKWIKKIKREKYNALLNKNTGIEPVFIISNKKALRIFLTLSILIATLAMSLTAIGMFNFDIIHFSTQKEKIVFSQNADYKPVTDIDLNYIPTGFSLCEKIENDDCYFYKYKNNKNFFNVKKITQSSELSEDTENYSLIEQKEGKYFLYHKNELYLIIHLKNNYLYTVRGDISLEQLKKIEKNLK